MQADSKFFRGPKVEVEGKLELELDALAIGEVMYEEGGQRTWSKSACGWMSLSMDWSSDLVSGRRFWRVNLD